MKNNADLYYTHVKHDLYDEILETLGCSAMWIVKFDNDKNTAHFLVTDELIFKHYYSSKYYLNDFIIIQNKSIKLVLGTDSPELLKNGFFFDLYKVFMVEEFVTMFFTSEDSNQSYSLRLFSKKNRFLFINKLIEYKPILELKSKKILNDLRCITDWGKA